MIQLSQILGFYPPILRDDPSSRKYLLKEYIQLLILDYLATTKHMRKLVFIGGPAFDWSKASTGLAKTWILTVKTFLRMTFCG